MTALIAERHPLLSLSAACAALGASRATWHRRRQPQVARVPSARAVSARALSPDERTTVMTLLHSPRFVDQPPREVYGSLLAEDTYHCSVRTMYRLLGAAGEGRERRDQRIAVRHPMPQLVATAPDQVWTWDITKLATGTLGVFLNLYLILDLFSRYIVGWMVAQRENSALAEHLIARTIQRLQIDPGQLTLHNDRGAPMTAHSFDALLTTLGIEASRSRPRVSNDNPYSESGFKTIKYQPDFPGRFADADHARDWMRRFVPWYHDDHRHEGLYGFTPGEVYSGRHVTLAVSRQRTLDTAYAAHPERWINRPPTLPLPPAIVAINPTPPLTPSNAGPLLNEIVPAESLIVTRVGSRTVIAT